jgi:hypothetical protein
MSEVDPRLVSAFRRQLGRRHPGARRLGWKVGAGNRERVGGELVVGNLTSATLLTAGARYEAGGTALHADAEVAVEMEDPDTVRGYGVALEIVDLGGRDTGEAAVVANVFHRAVAFGEMHDTLPDGLRAALLVDGEVHRESDVPRDISDRIRAVSRVLATVGERIRPGDRIITGSVAQLAIAAGDEVEADLGPLGNVGLSIA